MFLTLSNLLPSILFPHLQQNNRTGRRLSQLPISWQTLKLTETLPSSLSSTRSRSPLLSKVPSHSACSRFSPHWSFSAVSEHTVCLAPAHWLPWSSPESYAAVIAVSTPTLLAQVHSWWEKYTLCSLVHYHEIKCYFILFPFLQVKLSAKASCLLIIQIILPIVLVFIMTDKKISAIQGAFSLPQGSTTRDRVLPHKLVQSVHSEKQ